eukprot:TRINITY_DN18649_c0_g1_i1.p1 TRINITY_DN18649_c0_g1~~TRINITY_DN18649_c0_g1_i1.p1  ORF type:complete len:184 (-),score=13.51 TRINITY_DN18649_c0_g1_i1:53-604(-)
MKMICFFHGFLERISVEDPSGGAPCNHSIPIDRQCSGHGKCIRYNVTNPYKCQCDEDWAAGDCSYRRKSSLVAFILSLIMGFTGADRFYLGYIGLGVFKLILGCGQCVISCCFRCFVQCATHKGYEEVGSESKNCVKTSANLIIALVWCAAWIGATVWWFIDWISILKGNLDDHNGYALDHSL